MFLPIRRTRRALAVATGATAAVVLLAVPASAHVSIAETEVSAGAPATLTFGFGHGCDDSPTTRLRISIPESVPTPQPVVQAGWTIEVEREPLDEPVEVGHGQTVTERVSEVAFTAAEPVPGDFRASVQLSFTAPDEPGATLYFPVVQECSDGVANWTQIPADGQDPEELDSPAPSVAVVAGAGTGGHHDAATTAVPEVSTTIAGTDTVPADDAADEAANAGDAADSDSSDGTGRGLAIAGIVVGVVGLVAAGRALVSVSELKKQQQP